MKTLFTFVQHRPIEVHEIRRIEKWTNKTSPGEPISRMRDKLHTLDNKITLVLVHFFYHIFIDIEHWYCDFDDFCYYQLQFVSSYFANLLPHFVWRFLDLPCAQTELMYTKILILTHRFVREAMNNTILHYWIMRGFINFA